MRFTLANVWHPIGGVSILDLGVRFYLEVDVESIEQNGPWSFNSHILLLHRLREGEIPMGVELNWVAFWVLVHDIPHGFMSENVAKQLGNFIGTFLDYDTLFIQSGNMRVMQIRVKLDVRRSLQRRKKFALPNGVSAYVRFEYEKLSLFCFLCGTLGHGKSLLCGNKMLSSIGIFHCERHHVGPWFGRVSGYCTMDQSSGKVTGPNVNVQHVNFDEEMGFLKGEDALVQLVEGFKRPRSKGGFGWAIGCGVFVSRYSIATIFNLTAIVIFTLTAGIDVDSDGRSGGLSMGWNN
ncbi:hypothetical protein Goarm_003234 [Gossypium armourianum]|uniref:Zinc knuckle CX2CX4HX4C domain-containing protein n=1 Tax=Gossypium armourianum TaxID=34283 RepID=A0A7J9K2I2_9ROSI|nr:hypothetical protein [Gossypium armourianum]